MYPNGSFLTFKELERKFECHIDFIQLWGIIEAIPREWKRWLKENSGNNSLNHFEITQAIANPLKTIYTSLNKQEALLDILKNKWKDLDVSANDLKWYVNNTYRITNYVKLRSFQYRVINKALITNIHLFYYGIRTDKLCTYCNESEESMLHLLWECPKVQTFFEKIQKKWLKNIVLDKYKVIFNEIESSPKLIANLIILLAKHFIYISRFDKKTLSFELFVNYVNQIREIEKTIAFQNGKIGHHNKKWDE